MWNLALWLTRQRFRCADNKTCVPEFIVCDGIAHCEDGSDEGEVLFRGSIFTVSKAADLQFTIFFAINVIQ